MCLCMTEHLKSTLKLEVSFMITSVIFLQKYKQTELSPAQCQIFSLQSADAADSACFKVCRFGIGASGNFQSVALWMRVL